MMFNTIILNLPQARKNIGSLVEWESNIYKNSNKGTLNEVVGRQLRIGDEWYSLNDLKKKKARILIEFNEVEAAKKELKAKFEKMVTDLNVNKKHIFFAPSDPEVECGVCWAIDTLLEQLEEL